jgi:hypothetical protein
MFAWDAGNTLTVVGLVLSVVAVVISVVLFRIEEGRRERDRTAAQEEREQERRDIVVDVRLLVQKHGPYTERWFRISLIGGNAHTFVYLKRVAWRMTDDEWEEIIADEPPYIRLAAGQTQHVAPIRVVPNPCEVDITFQIDNETRGRRQTVVYEPWT